MRYAIVGAASLLLVTGCQESGSGTPSSAAPASSTPKSEGSQVAAPSTAPSTSGTPATSPASAVPTAEPTDCPGLCAKFVERRAECSDEFTKSLTMPADQIAKVKSNHQRDADGRECTRLCGNMGDGMAERVKEWGRCTTKERCPDFHTCFKEANK